ncbi:TPA: fimbrial biogenesis usher protein [Klebsiella quasipneumoniae]|nr:fimbrial biogenesis usher protein [Klebsiella quasipneumoniae]
MLRIRLLACLIATGIAHLSWAEEGKNQAIEFDSETLTSLGIDPKIARYFSSEAKFLPGMTSVVLSVNGKDRGNVVVSFDNDGQLCFDKSFMEQANILLPANYKEGCYDYLHAYPETILKASPGKGRLDLVVPQARLASQSTDISGYDTSGKAGVLNYAYLTSRNEFSGGHADYSQLMLDGGLNVNSWLLRSHQLLSRVDGKFASENSQTYLQRTFTSIKSTVRAGEVGMANPLLDGVELFGISAMPDSALSDTGGGVVITGIANTPQARVEIRQQGIMVFSTLVPAGPFTLTAVPLRNYTSDLMVTVFETDGTQHSQTVPSALYRAVQGPAAGYQFSFGRVSDAYNQQPWVASLAGGWKFNARQNVNTGLIVAQDYQALALRVDSALPQAISLSLQINQSFDRDDALQGQKYILSTAFTTDSGFGLNASSSKFTEDYRELSQAIDNSFTAYNKFEHSIGASWGHPVIGSMSASFYDAKGFDSQNDSRYVTLNWGKTFNAFSVSASWQRQLSGGSAEQSNDNIFYLNVNIPFQRHSLNAYARSEKGRERFGTSITGNISEDTSYNLGAERSQSDSQNSFSASINQNLHYSQLSVNASTSGSQNHSYSGMLRGGIAAHRRGVTFTPWAISDTFAVASLDKPISGVRLETSQGPVWTDFSGQAVIPSVTAWRNAVVEINTASLPKNMDIGNGLRVLKQGRGAVGRIRFATVTERRVLLDVVMGNGKPLPKGVAVTDSEGNYLTTSVDDGVLFLNNIAGRQTLVAKLENGSCHISLSLPETPGVDTFYENANGVCQ